MMGKLTFAAGVGVGYVLGARAGRERYEQIMAQVRGVKERPEVQEAVSSVKAQATDIASTAADTAKEKASTAAEAAKSKVGGGSGDSGSAAGTSTTTTTTPTPVVPPAPATSTFGGSGLAASDPLLVEPLDDPLAGATGTTTGTSGLGTGSTPAPTVPQGPSTSSI